MPFVMPDVVVVVAMVMVAVATMAAVAMTAAAVATTAAMMLVAAVVALAVAVVAVVISVGAAMDVVVAVVAVEDVEDVVAAVVVVPEDAAAAEAAAMEVMSGVRAAGMMDQVGGMMDQDGIRAGTHPGVARDGSGDKKRHLWRERPKKNSPFRHHSCEGVCQ
eukprot:symbB.v1.2.009812.t1/scaffold627.1/size179893/4